ncbi:Gibberellin 2-beta-dioxygenase 6 [Bienertia sinuspersici]
MGKLLEEYKEHLTRIASTIFEAMILNLKPNNLDAIKEYLDESTGLIRVYRYPSHSNGEQAKGLHEHTDSSILSILSEDQVGGLRFFKDEQWFKVKPNPTTLVVNLGDMMQVISDDEYKSVKHKVELNKEKERVSICYFVFPEENTLIHSSHFKPFTYNDFRAQVQLDLKTHGSKIGLVNFKLQHCQDHPALIANSH